MKTLKKDVIQQSVEVGRKTSIVAESLQTELDLLYSDILLGKTKGAKNIDEAYKKLAENTNKLMELALKEFSDVKNDLDRTTTLLLNNSLKGAKKLMRIDTEDKVKEYIKKITRDQLRENKKVTYRNGRRIGYKEYVEMATRTRIQHDIIKQTKEIGEKTMQLFYVCDTYSDCANDHLDWQGKMYYDEKVLRQLRSNPHYNEFMKGVRKCKSSVEKVTTGKPYLTTRPNCRHRLVPISIDDAIGLPLDALIKKHRVDKGNYKQSTIKRNYDDSQRQRRIEHNIRKHKLDLSIHEKAYKKTGDEEYLKLMNRSKYGIRLQQKNMRKLMNSNPSLKRDYRRENPYYMQKDLGVAYNEGAVKARVDFSYKKDVVEYNEENKDPFKEIDIFENHSLKDFIEDQDLIRKQVSFMEKLDTNDPKIQSELKVLNEYQGVYHEYMNKFMYNPDSLDERTKRRVGKMVQELHDLFHRVRKEDFKQDEALIVYRGTSDYIQENDTTLINNGFTSTSIRESTGRWFMLREDKDPALFKIIIPPESQNQTLVHEQRVYGTEAEVLIDTNAVYDIIAEETKTIEVMNKDVTYKEYTMILRPKHKGVLR